MRELENIVERAVVLAKTNLIDVADLGIKPAEDIFESGITLKEFHKRLIKKTLKETGGNKTHAANILGVSRRWLQYQLNE